jgi:hypothetical protein
MMKKQVLALSGALAAYALIAGTAQAAGATFTGLDDGSAVGGARPNSDAAKASFLAAASVHGATASEDFESIPTGYDASFSHNGLGVTLAAGNFGDGFSGVSSTTFGNVYGFDTTTGTGNWLGFPTGSATLSFASGTNSLGFFLTGVQELFGSTLTLTQNDGASTVYDLSSLIAANGGAGFFGVVDSTSFSSATLFRPGNDAWGIDDLVFNAQNAVPEPATWAMMIVGIGFAGAAMRRKQQPKVGFAF